MQECAQRQIYHDIIASALTEPSFDGVWFWGVTDRHSWVYDFYNTKQDESNEDPLPLLFDRDYNKKDSAYGAVRDALNTLTVHGRVGGNVLLDSDYYPDGRPWGFPWVTVERNISSSDSMENVAMVSGDCRPDWLQT